MGQLFVAVFTVWFVAVIVWAIGTLIYETFFRYQSW